MLNAFKLILCSSRFKGLNHGILLLLCALLTGCVSTPPPKEQGNICKIFKQNPDWYWAAQNTEKKWKVPIHTQFAIVKQESSFVGTARPPGTRFLGIQWNRPSSAYGYCQALKGTWALYRKSTGARHVDRDNFKDSLDFVGWYSEQVRKTLKISSSDAYNLYLAYHEGMGGYKRNSYSKKPWLKKVAIKVNNQAKDYRHQLSMCRHQLPEKPWYIFW